MLVALVAASLLTVPGGSAFARDRDRGGVRNGDRGARSFDRGVERYRGSYGRVVTTLPDRHRRVYVGSRPYYYYGGRFYDHHRDGFVYVRAPLGAIVATLPLGYLSFTIGGIGYYLADDVYYRRAENGYAVVEPPVEEVSGTAIVQIDQLNVRSGPSASYSVIKIISRGEQITIIGSVPGWYNVELIDGSIGWVMMRFVEFDPEAPQG